MKRDHFVLFALLTSLALFALNCTPQREYLVQGSERAAGADGHIDIELQEGGNWMVQLEVNNLLPPARLDEGLTTYVVWFQAADQQPQRMGTLTYDEDDRTGEMMATTTLSAFRLILTGEAEGSVVSPSEFVVFRTDVESPN